MKKRSIDTLTPSWAIIAPALAAKSSAVADIRLIILECFMSFAC